MRALSDDEKLWRIREAYSVKFAFRVGIAIGIPLGMALYMLITLLGGATK